MYQKLDSIFDDAENRYLRADELEMIGRYVDSLADRLEVYRKLRDHELTVMQKVADQLQAEMPQAKVEDLERSIKNALLSLRYCAMGMLMNDENFVKSRLLNWLEPSITAYNTQAIDSTLYRLLNQALNQILSPKQMSLLSPMLSLIDGILGKEPIAASAIGW
jgi:Phycobilisome protein